MHATVYADRWTEPTWINKIDRALAGKSLRNIVYVDLSTCDEPISALSYPNFASMGREEFFFDFFCPLMRPRLRASCLLSSVGARRVSLDAV